MTTIIFYVVVVGITCLFFCFLAHQVWVWISFVFRKIFGPFCPSCNVPLDPNGYCTGCLSKALQSESKPTLEKDLLAINRLLQHAQSLRLLDETQLASLRNCILTVSAANKKQTVADNKIRTATTLPTPGPVVAIQRTVVNKNENASTLNAIAPAKPVRSPLEEDKIPGFTPVLPSFNTPDSNPSSDTQAPLEPSEAIPPSVPAIAGILATSSLPKTRDPLVALNTPKASIIATQAPSMGEIHPLDAPDDPLDQSKSSKLGLPKIKKSTKAFTAEMIWSFMEKSNIRWMELAGAALVVICSAGLVISLWSKLSETNRFFPSVVFMVATLAVHGVGQYTLKKWKLRDTSRGILNIAMMLIPMSVMTGILLSKKESQLELGFQFYTVLTIGVLIYGTLAVTAAKSLFNSSWFPVASTTIVSSLSLVPLFIHCNSETGWYRIEFLLPAVAALTVFVWDLSVSSAYRRLRTEGYYRRQLAMLVHMFFASFSVIVFWWYLRPPAKPEFPSLFWALLGISGTALSSWGFINGKLRLPGNLFGLAPASLTSTDSERVRYTKPGLSNASPLVVGSWVIGIAAILMTFYSLSHIVDQRTAIIFLFAGMALWLGSFGWIARSPLSIAIAGLLGILAIMFSIERFGFGIHELSWEDWISFERVVTLGAIGTAFASVAALVQPILSSWEHHRKPYLSLGPQSWFDRWSCRLNDSEIANFMITSGVGAVLSAAILSFLATFIPVGRTPYGGTWAPLLVLTYGVALTFVGLLKIRSMPYLLPIAQGLTVYAAIQLSSHAESLPEILLALPAHQRTALGLAFIAIIWSMIFAVGNRCRLTGFFTRFMELINLRESQVFRSLGESSGGLAILSSLAMWFADNHMLEVTKWGWTLPLTLAIIWIAGEKTWFREGCLGSVMLWSNGAFHYLGYTRGWWSHLDHFTTAVLHALLITVLLFMFERFLNAGKRIQRVSRWFQGESGLAFDTCNTILCLFLTLGIGLVSATLYITTWSQVDWSTLELLWIPATDHGRTLQFAITTTTLFVFSAWLTWYSSRKRSFHLIHFWGIVPALAAALFCSLGMSADVSVLSSLVAFGVFGVAQAVAGGFLANRLAMHQAIISDASTETFITIENSKSWFYRLLNRGFGKFISASGYSTVMVGAILSLMSMQSVWGNSEFGSKWLSIFVFVYSWGILLAGFLRIQTSQYFIPIGQVLGLIATIKLCESTGWMPQWLIESRPIRSSAIGSSLLACVWAALYAVASRVKIFGISHDQSSFKTAPCVLFLGESSILVTLVAHAIFWMVNSQEHLRLVTHWGWCMPLAFLMVWIARERTYARDGLVAGLILWGQGALHHVGYEYGWWDGTGTFEITMLHVIFACVCLFAIDFLVAQLRRTKSLTPWLHYETEWTYGICNFLLLLVLVIGIASISFPQLISGLTGGS
ncbi:MAG: hypothetical protein FJ308_05560, partial [Planctomycetes bacterium]|nr:hypothetical protein [Planctomycetota bacterium]